MICRLCLKEIPKESCIKLYENEDTSIEMVKLIEKYLEINIKHNDVVSTIICQNCYDHLDEFHIFSRDVAEKQLTLQKEFLDVNLKEENSIDNDDDWNKVGEEEEDKFKIDPRHTPQEMIINCPVNVFKDESDNEERDEQEMPTDGLFDDVSISNEEKDIIAPDSVAPNADMNAIENLSSDDDVPLINLKSTKKATQKKKRKKVPAKVKEPREKKPARKKLSAEKELALLMNLTCEICQARVETWKALREHFLLAHTKTPYIKCCDIVYRKPRALMEHLEWHKNPDMFKCQICDQNMSSARNLTIHITSEHPNEAEDLTEFYECEHCSKRIRNYKLFKKHLRSHNKDKEVECHICNKRFATEFHLERHMNNFHKKAVQHICDICGRVYKNKTAFKHHQDEHQGIGSQAVQCSICQSWLKNENSLRLHRFVHEENPVPCNICGKMFKTQRSLYRHKVYWHTLETNLRCSFCDKVFRQKRNLDEHIAIHTGVQLYTCPHCGRDSRSKSNMYVHIKRMHPDEWWKSKMERLNLEPKNLVLSEETQII